MFYFCFGILFYFCFGCIMVFWIPSWSKFHSEKFSQRGLQMLPLSTITSSGFHPIFTVEIMQKCEDKIEGKRSVAHVAIARTIKPKYFKAWVNNLCFCSWKYFFKVWKHLHNSFLKRLHFQILIFDLSQTDITKNGKSRIFSGLKKKT